MDRLKELRIKHDKTQREIATLLNVTPKAISFYELGQREIPNESLKILADFFDVTTDFLSTIRIEHAADIRGKIVPVKTKTSVRSIPMPHSIMERVKAFSAHLYAKPKTNYFLVSVNELRRRMQTWSKRAGLKYILLHGLRHSHASYLINLGVPITAISHRLGHTNAQITLSTYSHLYKEDETSIAELLEKNMSI